MDTLPRDDREDRLDGQVLSQVGDMRRTEVHSHVDQSGTIECAAAEVVAVVARPSGPAMAYGARRG